MFFFYMHLRSYDVSDGEKLRNYGMKAVSVKSYETNKDFLGVWPNTIRYTGDPRGGWPSPTHYYYAHEKRFQRQGWNGWNRYRPEIFPETQSKKDVSLPGKTTTEITSTAKLGTQPTGEQINLTATKDRFDGKYTFRFRSGLKEQGPFKEKFSLQCVKNKNFPWPEATINQNFCSQLCRRICKGARYRKVIVVVWILLT